MKYYLVWDGKTRAFLARGRARECAAALGMRNVEQFHMAHSTVRDGLSKRFLFRDLSLKDPMVSPCWTCDQFPNPDYQEGVVCQSCGKPRCARQEKWISSYLSALKKQVGTDSVSQPLKRRTENR